MNNPYTKYNSFKTAVEKSDYLLNTISHYSKIIDALKKLHSYLSNKNFQDAFNIIYDVIIPGVQKMQGIAHSDQNPELTKFLLDFYKTTIIRLQTISLSDTKSLDVIKEILGLFEQIRSSWQNLRNKKLASPSQTNIQDTKISKLDHFNTSASAREKNIANKNEPRNAKNSIKHDDSEETIDLSSLDSV